MTLAYLMMKWHAFRSFLVIQRLSPLETKRAGIFKLHLTLKICHLKMILIRLQITLRKNVIGHLFLTEILKSLKILMISNVTLKSWVLNHNLIQVERLPGFFRKSLFWKMKSIRSYKIAKANSRKMTQDKNSLQILNEQHNQSPHFCKSLEESFERKLHLKQTE